VVCFAMGVKHCMARCCAWDGLADITWIAAAAALEGAPRSHCDDAKSSLGDAKSSLGDAKSWVTLRARWVTLIARWVTLRALLQTEDSQRDTSE
jgi:hypothetical protein